MKYEFSCTDYPQPLKDVTYVATLINMTVYWKYQSLGSGRFIGIFVEVHKRNEMKTIISKIVKENVTSLFLNDLEQLNDYVLTLYVATTVGRSHPIKLRATTIFRSMHSFLNLLIAIIVHSSLSCMYCYGVNGSGRLTLKKFDCALWV